MRKLGARSLPVVAQGERWLWASNTRDLAAFLGVSDRIAAPLAPDVLLSRWLHALRAAQRFAGQLPRGALVERAVAVRPRTVGVLGVHVFKIADNFLNAVKAGTTYDGTAADVQEMDPFTRDNAEMAAYGAGVIERLQQWQTQFTAEKAREEIPTITGPQPLSKVLERATCHSTQHTRQLQFVLEQACVAPDGPLTPQDLQGLPVPERLFE